MDKISWKIIDTYFTDNPNNLVAHLLLLKIKKKKGKDKEMNVYFI